MSFFYPDQAYPGDDPLQVARSMGIRPEQAMQLMMGGSGQMGGPQGVMGQFGVGQQQPDYDPNLLAEMVGQQYNPYQGYPTKQVSDQIWDIYGPTPEYLLPQMYNIQNPDAGRFDLDAFFQANPVVRGPVAEAHTVAKGDPIDMYAALQSDAPRETVNAKGETEMRPSIQDQLRGDVGRTEWAELAENGYMPIIRAANRGASPEEMDDIAMEYYMSELEGVLAGGAPTSQKAERELDYTRQDEGFRPAPGTGSDMPGFGGAGFGAGGADPLADLVGSPQYGGMGGGGAGGQIVREDEGGFWVRPGADPESFNAPAKRAAELIRSGRYRQGTRGGSRRQDANGGGDTGGGGRRPWWNQSGLSLAMNFFRGGRDNNRGPSRRTIRSRNMRPEYGIRGR